ncbi:MAG: lysylphosphatidylglycerol synthase transmembrane domain-containing protein [Candidatus Omnitrophota bacterium]
MRLFFIEWFKQHRRLISFSFLFVFITGYAYYIFKNREEIRHYLSLSPLNLIFLIISMLLLWATVSVNIKILLNIFNIRLRFKEYFGLYVITMMANYILPAKGGFIPMAVYLKTRHSFEYSKFLIFLLSFYIFTFFINCMVGIGLVFMNYFIKNELNLDILLIFVLVLVFIILLLSIVFGLNKKNLGSGFLGKAVAGFKVFVKKKKLLYSVAGIQAASIFFMSLKLLYAYRALGIDIDIISAALIGLIGAFSVIISITPANLGVREFFVTISSKMVGYTATEGVMAAMLDRCIGLILTFILGAIFSYILFGGFIWKKKASVEVS